MIFLDMDGVLCDFIGSACHLHGWDPEEVLEWNFFEKYGLNEDEFWEPINNMREHFWLALEKYPWTDEILSAVRKADKKFSICTKPSDNPYCLLGKRLWIDHHLGPKFNRVIYMKDKEALAQPGRLLIDDSDANVSKFQSEGGDTCLFPQNWNSNRNLTANPMSQVYDALDRYRNRQGK